MRLSRNLSDHRFVFAEPANDNGERSLEVLEDELRQTRELQEKLERWDPRSQALPWPLQKERCAIADPRALRVEGKALLRLV